MSLSGEFTKKILSCVFFSQRKQPRNEMRKKTYFLKVMKKNTKFSHGDHHFHLEWDEMRWEWSKSQENYCDERWKLFRCNLSVNFSVFEPNKQNFFSSQIFLISQRHSNTIFISLCTNERDILMTFSLSSHEKVN